MSDILVFIAGITVVALRPRMDDITGFYRLLIVPISWRNVQFIQHSQTVGLWEIFDSLTIFKALSLRYPRFAQDVMPTLD